MIYETNENKEEKMLNQKIKMALLEKETLTKLETKNRSEFIIKKTKTEEERNVIIDLFADFVVQKNIIFEFANPIENEEEQSISTNKLKGYKDKYGFVTGESGLNKSAVLDSSGGINPIGFK